jgi:predicted RNA-binding Zn-ribbon protein involved in translation (DUF1610 family)
MTLYRPATFHSDSIVRPPCPKCGIRMLLSCIEPEKLGYETQIFECPKCEHSISTVANLKQIYAAAWPRPVLFH